MHEVEQFTREITRKLAEDPALVEVIQRHADAHAENAHEQAARRVERAGQNHLGWLALGLLSVLAALLALWVTYDGGETAAFGLVGSCITCALVALAALGTLVSDPFVSDEQAVWLRRWRGRLRSFWPRLRLHGKAMALAAVMALGVQVMAARHESWERAHQGEIDDKARRQIDDALAVLRANLERSGAEISGTLTATSAELKLSLERLRAGADDAYSRIVEAAAPRQTEAERELAAKAEAVLLSTSNPLSPEERERAARIVRLSSALMSLLLRTQETSERIGYELGILALRTRKTKAAARAAEVAAAEARDGSAAAREAALAARAAALAAQGESTATSDAAAQATDKAAVAAALAEAARLDARQALDASKDAREASLAAAKAAGEARAAAIATRDAVFARLAAGRPDEPPPVGGAP